MASIAVVSVSADKSPQLRSHTLLKKGGVIKAGPQKNDSSTQSGSGTEPAKETAWPKAGGTAPFAHSCLVLSKDAKFLYASCSEVGGVLTVLGLMNEGTEVRQVAQTVLEAAEVVTMAAGLAFVGLNEEMLVVACPIVHRLLSFRRHSQSGKLERAEEVECPSPFCLLPLPWPPLSCQQ